MGWLFSSNLNTKAALIKHLTEEQADLKTLAKAVRGNVLWTVQEDKNGGKFIGCYLMGVNQGWWGSKDMCETMGPCEKSCPVKFFDMVPDPGGYATEWRAKVKEAAAKMAAQKAKLSGIKVGCKVRLIPGCKAGGIELTELTITSVKPLLARSMGFNIRIKPKHVAEVLPGC